MNISIHNSQREVEQTPALIGQLKIIQKSFPFENWHLPYCEKAILPELPGAPLLVMVLHGAGSVGDDNFLHIRIPAEPLIGFFESIKRKTVLIMPQCAKGFQWVDVPWTSTAHTLPETPSKYMAAALALWDLKQAEYAPGCKAVLGTSMGGYGAWDMACRRDFDIIGVMCGGADVTQAPRFKSSRICIYHGDQDNAVPVCRARDMAAALEAAGCQEFRYKEFKGTAHNVWDSFYTDGEALPYLFEN